MKSLGEILHLSAQFLSEKKIDRARRIAEEILAHALKCKRIDLYLYFDRPIEEAELTLIRDGIRRASRHEPVDYITGEVDFFGVCLAVNSSVLIPRQETEYLLDIVSKKIQGQKIVWDVCCGSGCIGIALKKKFPHLEVHLTDISEEALKVAKQNALRNQVDVTFHQGDLLEPLKGQRADLILCNPPYVSEKEFLTLDPSVKDFEPKLALVGDLDGFGFYQRLAEELPMHLNPGGSVFLEMGSTQKKGIETIFEDPIWRSFSSICDLSGRERFFFLEKQSLSSVSYTQLN